ncbi:MAG TPA: metal ABC transporter substrate-binding protein [Candidatus Binatia bacterium]|nr:metal ABC transporter substrate-binding protein [Candidatus Binatia bacterium]
MTRRSPLLAALAVALLVPGVAAAKIRVVSSIPALAMIASEVGGQRVEVHSLITGGATPHNYSPRPSDARAVADADVILFVGGGVDDWTRDMADAADGAIVLELLPRRQGGDDHAGHGHDVHRDPHVWLDPGWMRDNLVPAIVRALSQLDPPAAPQLEAQGRVVRERLTNLEEDIRQMFEKATVRKFVAFHPAWGRFASRFDLQPLGAIEESGGEEPTLRRLVTTMRAARSAGVATILVEPQLDQRVATTLAAELGGNVVTVDPFGDLDSFDRNTYQELMLLNAAAFAQAMAIGGE